MDHQRFDDLTRALAVAGSRRRVLKGLVGATLGGVLASFGDRADASSKRNHECDSDTDCGE
jgi:hypothetical protein